MERLQTGPEGLTDAEASQRLSRYGARVLWEKKHYSALALFLSQFKSPIILLLIFAAFLSFALQEREEASIILVIIAVSGVLGFWQENSAESAVSRLLEMVRVRATVVRGGEEKDVPHRGGGAGGCGGSEGGGRDPRGPQGRHLQGPIRQ